MADPEEDNQIYWHTPQMRGVIPLDDRFKVSKNLKRLYKRDKFDLYINRNFDQVIDYCRSLREDETWISDEIIDAYKLALVFLVEFLREHNFLLLDTQYLNPHIAQFGAYEITHQEYIKLLRRAIAAS